MRNYKRLRLETWTIWFFSGWVFLGSYFTATDGLAQRHFSAGTLPKITLSTKWNARNTLSFTVESRQLWYTGHEAAHQFSPRYSLTDLAVLNSLKVGVNNHLSGGYQIRLTEDNQTIHRFIQQFTFVHRYSNFRLSQRFVTDQTLLPAAAAIYRLRYRVVAEHPLNGESVDPHEFYLKFGTEFLNILQNRAYNLEMRLVPAIGYAINDKNKLELASDYRIDSFLQKQTKSVLWLNLNWYVSI